MGTTRAADRAAAAALSLALVVLALTALAAVGFPGPARAAELQDVTIELNGQALLLDPPAFLSEGRTFVPLRGLFERLGAQVAYDPTTREITITRGSASVLLNLDGREAVVNGQVRTLDEPLLVINQRTYVPARFVAEALGDRVDWHGQRSTLAILSVAAQGLDVGPDGYAGQARTPVVPYTEAELDLLTRLINAEAYGEPYEGMVAVGAVVVNRVLHPRWPNTIYDVIMHPGQFAPIWNGHINRPVRPEARLAAIDALHGVDPSNGAIFFYNPRTARRIPGNDVIITIGNHAFAR